MSIHRLAVIGCGVVSDMHFRGYLARPDRVKVVAAVDPIPERRRHVERAYGVPVTYATIAELVDDAEFDVAVVCTPSHIRLAAVEELAAAGKHLLVEKPLADGLEEGRRIVALADEAGIKLAVDQNFRDHYAFGLARDTIRAGRIGPIIAIDHRELTFREVAGWRAQSRRHALSVMGVHWLDGFRYLVESDADWVVATTRRSPAVAAAGETDAVVHLRFGSVGVNYVQSFSSRVDRVETIVTGERGTLAFGYSQLELASGEGVTISRNPCAEDKPQSAYRSLERLLDAIEDDHEPDNSGRDNLKTLALLEAAYLSAARGDLVHLKEGLL